MGTLLLWNSAGAKTPIVTVSIPGNQTEVDEIVRPDKFMALLFRLSTPQASMNL